MRTIVQPHIPLLAVLALPCVACAQEPQETGFSALDLPATSAHGPQEVRHNTLTDEERAAGWKLLFDGRSLQNWRRYDGGDMTEGWMVEEGTLAHVGGGYDIIYDESFVDFELALEWKVEPGGNSGIFYRAALGERRIYHSAPEMQILDDDGHPDGRSPLTSAGSNYGLHAPAVDVTKPAGEWNSARIVVDGDSVQHWLNGEHLLSYELGSEEWLELVENSKFNEWPMYGLASSGYVGLQDHGNRVWFRNLKIKEKH